MKPYLKEDEEIISEIKEIMSSSNTNSLIISSSLAKLQIEATLRNRKSLEDSSRQSAKFSIILAAFALVQFVIMLFQFAISFLGPKYNIWIGAVLVIIMYFMIRSIFKEFDKILKKLS